LFAAALAIVCCCFCSDFHISCPLEVGIGRGTPWWTGFRESRTPPRKLPKTRR
jgi:hypothetical protein